MLIPFLYMLYIFIYLYVSKYNELFCLLFFYTFSMTWEQPHETNDNIEQIYIMEAHTVCDEITDEKEVNNMTTSVASDFDSALSSAPPSLSPQPESCPNSPVVWPKERDKHGELQQTKLHADLLQELECAKEHIKILENEIEMVKNF